MKTFIVGDRVTTVDLLPSEDNGKVWIVTRVWNTNTEGWMAGLRNAKNERDRRQAAVVNLRPARSVL